MSPEVASQIEAIVASLNKESGWTPEDLAKRVLSAIAEEKLSFVDWYEPVRFLDLETKEEEDSPWSFGSRFHKEYIRLGGVVW